MMTERHILIHILGNKFRPRFLVFDDSPINKIASCDIRHVPQPPATPYIFLTLLQSLKN